MANAKPLHLRLFLEGIEVPVISAQISINTNSPATAAVQIVPLDEAQDLKPRSMVHLFYLDTQVVVSEQSKEFTGINGVYRLLFSGEAVGFSYVQTPQSRGFVLQAVDFSNYWDSAHATAISYGPGGNLFTNHSAVHGSGTGQFDDIADFPAERLVGWIRDTPPPKTPGLQTVKGLAAGIIKMMEAMGGVWPHFKGINDFFTVAELRCRLLQQIAAEENDNTAHRLLSGSVFMEWLKNGLQCMGGQVTFRDMMLMLFKYVYYEFVPNPAPKFEQGETLSSTSKVVSSVVTLAENPTVIGVVRDLKKLILMVESFQSVDSQNKSAVKAKTTAAVKACNLAIKKLETVAVESNDLVAAIGHLKNAISGFNDSARSGNNALEKAINSLVKPLDFVRRAIDLLEKSSDEMKVLSETLEHRSKSQRLKTQIVRPDCWFSPPPKCNVIFPEQYTQISYDRNWLSETTRVLVQEFNTLIGADALLDHFYLAPAFGSSSADLNRRMKGEASYRYLLEHEIHTGILPKTEWLPDTAGVNPKNVDKKYLKGERGSWIHRAALFHFYKYRFAPRQASVGGRFNPLVVCGFPALVIREPYNVTFEELQKAVAQQKKLSPGTMDSLSDAEVNNYLHELSKELGAPAQFVGQVAGVNHNIDQSGGSTSISLHHVRRHLGVDDEFLSTFMEAGEPSKKVIQTVLTADMARKSLNPLLKTILIGVTPQDPSTSKRKAKSSKVKKASISKEKTYYDPEVGEWVKVSSDGSVASTQTVVEESKVPSFCKTGSVPKAGLKECLVPDGKTVLKTGSGGFFGKKSIVGIQVLQPTREMLDGKYVFNSVAIYEEVEYEQPSKMPIEEVIRPAWFSLAYRNDRIGKDIYDNFFGCGSIVDVLQDPGLRSFTEIPSMAGSPDVPSMSADKDPKKLLEELKSEEARRSDISTEKAVNVIAYNYGRVKARGGDVDAFIRSFTDRPIATLDDIFGEGGGTLLRFRVSKGEVIPYRIEDGKEVTGANVGFHSTAVHPDLLKEGVPAFAGLMTDPALGVKRMGDVGKASSLEPRYDVRAAKRKQVDLYVTALAKRAFQG